MIISSDINNLIFLLNQLKITNRIRISFLNQIINTNLFLLKKNSFIIVIWFSNLKDVKYDDMIEIFFQNYPIQFLTSDHHIKIFNCWMIIKRRSENSNSWFIRLSTKLFLKNTKNISYDRELFSKVLWWYS